MMILGAAASGVLLCSVIVAAISAVTRRRSVVPGAQVLIDHEAESTAETR